jgi:deoxyribodipyrimidine photo-lyase
VAFKPGGPLQAKGLLARFMRDRLAGYHLHRKEAHLRHQSFLSPYLHYGHVSPIYIALKVGTCPSSWEAAAGWAVVRSRRDFTHVCVCMCVRARVRVCVCVRVQVRENKGPASADDKRRFVDELVIWRELAANNVFWNEEGYDSYDAAVPQWAKDT